MFAIATAELRMLVRNRLVAFCAILLPLGFGAFLLFSPAGAGTASYVATLSVMIMVAMGVYITATTTIAARRQTLFLKRLRSGSISDAKIIFGLLSPIVLINIVQVAVVLTVLSITESVPENILLLALAVILAEVMFAGFALATAGITTSPEHAQVTTLPLFFITIGVAVWVLFTGTDDLGWVKRALPGGGIGELIGVSYGAEFTGPIIALIAPSLAWAYLAIFAARSMFKWEPRA